MRIKINSKNVQSYREERNRLAKPEISLRSLRESLIRCRLKNLSPTMKNLKENIPTQNQKEINQQNNKIEKSKKPLRIRRKASKSAIIIRPRGEPIIKMQKAGEARSSVSSMNFRMKLNGIYDFGGRRKEKPALMNRIYEKINIAKKQPKKKRKSATKISRGQRKSRLLRFSNDDFRNSITSKRSRSTSIFEMNMSPGKYKNNSQYLKKKTISDSFSSKNFRSFERIKGLWMDLRSKVKKISDPDFEEKEKNNIYSINFINRKMSSREKNTSHYLRKIKKLGLSINFLNRSNNSSYNNKNKGFFFKKKALPFFHTNLNHKKLSTINDTKMNQKIYDKACIQYTIKNGTFKKPKIHQMDFIKKTNLFKKRYTRLFC